MKKSIILVVNDEKSVAENIAACLRKHDLNADIATSGEDAIDYADKHNPDLIIVKFFMSGMDGYEVVKRLKTHKKPHVYQ